MSTDYNLAKGEFVIMQSDGVELLDGAERTQLEEIVLTNQSLILVRNVRRGIFQQMTLLKRCSLNGLAVHDDAPIHVGKVEKRWGLRVPFESEVISLSFPEDARQTALRWAKGIRLAAIGEIGDIQTEDALPAEIAIAVDGARNIFQGAKSAINTVLGNSATNELSPKEKRDARVTIKCSGCHAPLYGIKGRHITCPYCDTDNVL